MMHRTSAKNLRRTKTPGGVWIAASALLGIIASNCCAAENRFVVNFGDRFQTVSAKPTWQTAVIAAAALVAAGMAGWLALRFLQARQRRLANSPRQLFKDLCSAHQLSFHERRLLTRLAVEHRLPQPSILFTDPQFWNEQRLGPAWCPSRQAISDLRDKLFAAK